MTVQPDVLRAFADRPEFRGRGLVARFWYALPPSLVGARDTEPPPVPEAVRDAYAALLTALLDLPLPAVSHRLILDARAAARFRAYVRDVEPQLGEFGRLGDMADWGGKLAGAVARLAGLLHLATFADHPTPWDEPIDAATLDAAIRLGDYLIPHALAAAAAMGADAGAADARYLARWLTTREEAELPEQAIWQATKGRFGQAERLRAALGVLTDHGYIRPLPPPPRTAGRPPRPTYAVNPLFTPKIPTTPTTPEQGASAANIRDSRDFRLKNDTAGAGDAPAGTPAVLPSSGDPDAEAVYHGDLDDWLAELDDPAEGAGDAAGWGRL